MHSSLPPALGSLGRKVRRPLHHESHNFVPPPPLGPLGRQVRRPLHHESRNLISPPLALPLAGKCGNLFITAGGKKVVELKGMPRPFAKMRELVVEDVAKEALAALGL